MQFIVAIAALAATVIAAPTTVNEARGSTCHYDDFGRFAKTDVRCGPGNNVQALSNSNWIVVEDCSGGFISGQHCAASGGDCPQCVLFGN